MLLVHVVHACASVPPALSLCPHQTIVMSYEEVFSSPLPSLLELNALAAAADSALESMLAAGTAAPQASTAGEGAALLLCGWMAWHWSTRWHQLKQLGA